MVYYYIYQQRKGNNMEDYDYFDMDDEYGQYEDDYKAFEDQCAWEDAMSDMEDWG